MSVFRNMMLAKAYKTEDYIRLSPDDINFGIQQDTETIEVESNSEWNINIK